MSTYLPNDLYENLIDKLSIAILNGDLISPANGDLDPDRIKESLGFFGDIWPECIREDAEAAKLQ